MQNTKRALLTMGAVLALSLTLSVPAMAKQKVMKIATWLPAMHLQNAGVFPKYKEMVEQATDGRVTIKLEYGMGHPNSMYDLVEDGVVDASYTYNGYIAGRFDKYRFFELPTGERVDVQKAAVAMYKTMDKYYNNNGEFPAWEGLHVAGVFFHPPMNIFTPEPVKSFADLKGKKIVANNIVRGDISEHYGMAPMNMPAPKVYEAFQQGVIDAAAFPYEAQVTLRHQEVAPYIMETNMNIGHFTFVISRDFLDSLGAKDRKAVIDLSGEKFSHMAGGVWHTFNEDVRKTIPADRIINADALGDEFKDYKTFLKQYREQKLAEYEKTDPKVREAYAYYLGLLK